MPEPILAGRLEFVGLPSLLQLVEAESITGRLSLADAARLELWGGRVVAADYAGFGGRHAALEAFLVGRGAFALSRDEVAEARPLCDTIELMMTGCRLVDEWGRLAPLYLSAVDAVDDDHLAPLIPHLQGGPVQAAVARAGLPRSASVDPLLNGIEQGWLRQIDGPGEPEPAVVGDEDVDALVDLARAHVRDRRLDEAEDLLQRALRLRPEDRIASQNLARVQHLKATAAPDRR